MFLTTTVLLLTAVLNIALGCIVYAYNPTRHQNRQFSIFSANVGLWALCMTLVTTRHDLSAALHWIRAACAVSACLPLTFFLLCLSIRDLAYTGPRALRQNLYFVIGTLLAFLVAFCPYFLHSVTLPAGASGAGMAFPEPHYGPLFLPFNLFFLVTFGGTMFAFIRDMVRSSGIQRIELQFVLLGMLLTLVFTLSTQIFIPLLTGSGQTQPFGPIGVLAMNLTIAYGIATRRIMDAAGVLRRAVAYTLLTAYLVAVFFLTHVAIGRLVPVHTLGSQFTASVVAGIMIALSLAPAQVFMRRVADWLLLSSRARQLAGAVESVTASLQSVSTMPALLASFSETMARLTASQKVWILLHRKRNFEQVFPLPPSGTAGFAISETDAIPQGLKDLARPLMAEELLRERQSPEILRLREAMQVAGATVIVGIRSRGRLIGMLLLGSRASGRIFGIEEQHYLQVVCNHLGIAIENARLYTESVQNRLHSETLLNNLVNGVVATDADGEISMINREAQRICRLVPPANGTLRLEELPGPVADALRRTLESGAGERDVDTVLSLSDGPPMPVRLGTSPFHDAEGRIMGALAVLSDQTTVHKLESQIRRTDRLASVGTLAAGMAHEIKNPLVTISTFTQLLPERYNDSDFRETFTDLVRHEVQRMNLLVNQLLRFARPAPPLLAPTRLADVLEHSLRLLEQQIQNQRIELDKTFANADAIIRADSNQLEQAFVNFLLNALQAMPPEGRLSLILRAAGNGPNGSKAGRGAESQPTVEVVIRDTGCGIARENLNSIFDPFFTTRSEGTGLGLSVAHGIITDHGGKVEVESSLGVGTTFTITFPVLVQEPVA